MAWPEEVERLRMGLHYKVMKHQNTKESLQVPSPHLSRPNATAPCIPFEHTLIRENALEDDAAKVLLAIADNHMAGRLWKSSLKMSFSWYTFPMQIVIEIP